MVDRNGNIVNNYQYDEWGNIQVSNEMVSNPFKYAGEIYDQETGLYYLRARYYDPTMGRFINEDSFEGQVNNPLSLNGYTYCANNPMMYVDPSGHIPIPYIFPVPDESDSYLFPFPSIPGGNNNWMPYPGKQYSEDKGLGDILGDGLKQLGDTIIDGYQLQAKVVTIITFPIVLKGMEIIQSSQKDLFGQNGVKVTSKTLWQNGKTERIDIENPNPAKRAGDIHYHTANNTKYRFDPVTKKFYDENEELAPNSVQNLLKNKSFQKNIDKGLKMLGEDTVYSK